MSNIEIDPEVLDTTATIVEGYCNRQKTIMEDYLSNASALASDWTDDKTLGPLLEEIRTIKNNVTTLMDEIRTKYPRYFREKAEEIRNRPKF